jgi:hypothetical protein
MKWRWAILLAILLIGIFYFTFNPATAGFFPKCPFFSLTGYKCPGCGSQRALHALLHLHIATAFAYNALLVMSLPILILLGFTEATRTRYVHFYVKVHTPLYIILYFFVVIAWWICRNVFDW